MAEIEEDLNVMARIFEKTVEQQIKATPVMKLGVVLHSAGLERPQAIFLDGYGALFVLQVQVPLLPTVPAGKVESGTVTRQLPWDQIRQELYGGNAPAESIPSAGPLVAYDAELVARLKQQLLEALGGITPIRNHHAPTRAT